MEHCTFRRVIVYRSLQGSKCHNAGCTTHTHDAAALRAHDQQKETMDAFFFTLLHTLCSHQHHYHHNYNRLIAYVRFSLYSFAASSFQLSLRVGMVV